MQPQCPYQKDRSLFAEPAVIIVLLLSLPFFIGLVWLSMTTREFNYLVGKPFAIQKVTKVFMHKDNHWSVLVQQADGGQVIKNLYLSPSQCPDSGKDRSPTLKLFNDVPDGRLMWVKAWPLTRKYLDNGQVITYLETFCRLEFHVRSERNVEGGDWEEKSRDGKTPPKKHRTNVVR